VTSRQANKQMLQSRAQNLNMLLERPMTELSDSSNKHNVGHLTLEISWGDRGSLRYQLIETLSADGGCQPWSDVLNSSEMRQFLDGMVKGIAIRNAHLTQHILKQELSKHGFDSDHALYSDDLRQACMVFKQA
jgi:hypothetical protein